MSETPLAGVLAFPVTPFGPDGDLDLEGLAFNASWLADFDLAAIVAPSGTGEFFTLTEREATEVMRITVDAVDRRVPVVAGVGIGPRSGAAAATTAAKIGVDALLVLPPYYPDPDSAGLVEYYTEIGGATELPFMIYGRGSAQPTVDTIIELARRLPNFVAFKEGRNDVRGFQRMRLTALDVLGAERLTWLVGVGDDLVAPFFAAGADGYTSSLACFWPEASIAILDAARGIDPDAMARLQHDVVKPFYDLRARGQGLEVSVMKSAMQALGLPSGSVRPPLADVTPEVACQIADLVERLQIPRRS